MNKKCRHNKTWLIGYGTYEWCYQCGALRGMKQTGKNSVTSNTQWQRPVGKDGSNPYPLKKLKKYKG